MKLFALVDIVINCGWLELVCIRQQMDRIYYAKNFTICVIIISQHQWDEISVYLFARNLLWKYANLIFCFDHYYSIRFARNIRYFFFKVLVEIYPYASKISDFRARDFWNTSGATSESDMSGAKSGKRTEMRIL